MGHFEADKVRASIWGILVTAVLGVLIIIGSRNLAHFDAALVGYTFATLFAAFGINYRYSMWLQRPPTKMYWRRGWRYFLEPSALPGNILRLLTRVTADIAANRFIFRRNITRWMAHWLLMAGCILAAAITFPLVWGWVHFQTVGESFDRYRTYVFGFPGQEFAIDSILAFIIFHGLVWSSILVIGGVMLAFRRRMIDHGAAAGQQFGEDVMPLLLLFAISVTGLMLTASYTWMKGYAYDFLAIMHAVTVIMTLLWLPFGKFFHIFQRPAQLGVTFYKDAGARSEQAECRRCGTPFASAIMVRDLMNVEKELGFSYEINGQDVEHYQQICPRCRRAMFGLAQGRLWRQRLGDRLQEGKPG